MEKINSYPYDKFIKLIELDNYDGLLETAYKYNSKYYIETSVGFYNLSNGCCQHISYIFNVKKDNLKKYLNNEILIYDLIKCSNEIVIHDELYINEEYTHEFYKSDFNKLNKLEYLPHPDANIQFNLSSELKKEILSE